MSGSTQNTSITFNLLAITGTNWRIYLSVLYTVQSELVPQTKRSFRVTFFSSIPLNVPSLSTSYLSQSSLYSYTTSTLPITWPTGLRNFNHDTSYTSTTITVPDTHTGILNPQLDLTSCSNKHQFLDSLVMIFLGDVSMTLTALTFSIPSGLWF